MLTIHNVNANGSVSQELNQGGTVSCAFVVQVMWLLSGKVSEDIFRKQLERIVGAVAAHLQQQGQSPLNASDAD